MRQCGAVDTRTAIARDLVGERDPELHAERLGDGRERGRELVAREPESVERELDSLEEDAGGVVDVLVGMQDVAAVTGDEVGHAGDQTPAVGAGDQEDGARGHLTIVEPGPALRGRRRSS